MAAKGLRKGAAGWGTLVSLASESKLPRLDNALLRWPPGASGRQARAEILADAQRVVSLLCKRSLLEKPKSPVDKHLRACVGLHALVHAQMETERPTMGVSLSLVCDETIAELNENDRDVPMPTDVLSYPMFAMHADFESNGGSISMSGHAAAKMSTEELLKGMFDPSLMMKNGPDGNMQAFDEEFQKELDKWGSEEDDENIDLSKYEAAAADTEYYEGADALKEVDLSASEDATAFLGDLIISADTAALQADERGHSLRDEIRILLVHGALHLALFDHETKKDAKLMRQAEDSFLEELGWNRSKGLVTLGLD
ncbi:Hypothetical Protein FCC1311_030412 [Hondaea fermentalgiana]|uniref:Uncharacterized protein n=1 Tax=Hondaea fermentalgiana TaxID=2315210 RepID=A0A2R5G907_9STRA|nr:Hypothetical Protein FCC1311_030412 [Hondaea fermentalgiana]|eukprot:GBG26819.1 Hypothetical Protein FCC1311_030412 [Hondaea fermentalgiana]